MLCCTYLSNKQLSSGGSVSEFPKGETFFISYNNKVLLGAHEAVPFLHPSKRPSSPFPFGQEENITGLLFERKAY